jgi:hydroxymethylpyrimidine/phosphomethylpyrimidine kinase
VRLVGVVTATTTQDTRGVRAVHPVATLAEEFGCLLEDLRPDAVKIGMLAGAGPVVARALAGVEAPIVWDPVRQASRGGVVLGGVFDPALLALVRLVTPNLAEAEAQNLETMKESARRIPARAVLVKGGHLPGPPIDVLRDGESILELAGERIDAGETHGTGCVLSTAIACGLAAGLPLERAVRDAKAYLEQKLRSAFAPGRGARCLV